MFGHGSHLGVVVGVDGSPSSMMAVRWATREATRRNIPLTLVNVIPTPAADSSSLAWPASLRLADIVSWQEERGREAITDAIKAAEDSVQDGNRPEINTEFFFAAPVSALVELSKRAQMLVVGCRGQGALQRALLGSVSTALVHHAHCPVAVIHDEAPMLLQFSQLPVLVGIDGSPASELAAALAFEEASFRGVELVALHAWTDADMATVPGIDSSALKSAAEKTLAERLAGFRERYPDLTVRRLVVFNYPARHLLRESESAQLVVVGSHGRGGFAGMLLGSVSAAVVHTARIPVIVARQH